MTLKEFIKKHTGVENVGNTPANKGQCVGLVMVYIDEVLGLSHFWGNAKDLLYNAPDDKWDKFLNTPLAVPIQGDVLVWKGIIINNIETPGHTAIFKEGNVNDFYSFDANYPVGSKPHIQYHTYDNLLGWMRPKKKPVELQDGSESLESNTGGDVAVKSKEWYKSRTLWVQALAIAGGLLLALSDNLAAGGTLTAMGIVGIILRVLTDRGLTFPSFRR